MSLTRLSAFCSRCSNIWSRSISLSAVVDPVKRGRGRPRKVEPVSLSEEEEKPARRTRAPEAVAEETDTPKTRRTSRSKTSGDKVADNPLHGPLGLDGLLKHPAAHSAPLTNTPKWTFDGDVDPKVYLPPPSEWENTVWARAYKKLALRDRVFLKNPVSAYQLAQAFVPEGLRDQVIIEAFPGPGALTRALLQLPKERIRKIIVLEDWPEFLAYLRPLQTVDSRVHVVPLRGFYWNTYQAIEDQGLLDDVPKLSWGSVHPQLRFISQMEQHIHGEQLIAQLFRSIPNKTWLFKYGRVPMHFVMAEKLLERIVAGPHETARCKLGVIANATAEVSVPLPASALSPYDDHFHPDIVGWARRPNAFCGVTIAPLQKQVIASDMLDKWDYCLRRLFVLKGTPLKTAIDYLGPGAQTLLKTLCHRSLPDSIRLDANKTVRRLEVEEWARVVSAFDQWPFAPDALFVTDNFGHQSRH